MSQAPEAPAGNRLVLLLIAGTPLTMILAASWLWYFVINGDLDLVGAIGTANNGTLVTPPRQISEVALFNDAGAGFGWSDIEPRWTLLMAHRDGACDRSCQEQLYFTRQVHIALGKDFNRVRRVFVTTEALADAEVEITEPAVAGWPDALEGQGFTDYLALSHKGLVALQTNPASFDTLFPEVATRPDQWFLVDPAGWVMMRFDPSLDYKAVISDLKFLLKNSGGA